MSEKIKAKSWPELTIKGSKESKKESREMELWALKADMSQEMRDKIVKQEQEWRKILDRDIEQAKERLRNRKNR